MKKTISALLCLILVIACLMGMMIVTQAVGIDGSAPDTEIKTDPSGFKYYISEGVVTICGYVGSETDLLFPSSEEGYPVTNIGSFSFTGFHNITSIVIPEGVEKISVYAFEDCIRLETVTLAQSVTEIGENAFSNCGNLQTVYYSGSEARWNAIDIQRNNDDLLAANIIFGAGESVTGDLDGSGDVDNKDVEYLLWHTLFPADYPLSVDADFDGSGGVNNKDVEYLLWHTLFPEDYPLSNS